MLKDLFDQLPILNHVRIRGEISNYKRYPSGHHYFTLKDAESSLKCVLFKGNAMGLTFVPKDGMTVIAEGRVSVYPRDGLYQLYVNELQEDGIGVLYVAFEALKKKLEAEGLFREEHKKPLPEYPKRIVIITSSSGAAIHDMLRILRTRYPLTECVLLPVRVQGEEAPGEIIRAIQIANQWEMGDLIITGRGGGSIEDLWAFNDEGVARAIYASNIPIISAVGHEPDVTISDYVADRRASTPSNAAEIAVPDKSELQEMLDHRYDRLLRLQTSRLQMLQEKLKHLMKTPALVTSDGYVKERKLLLEQQKEQMLHSFQCLLESKQREISVKAASLHAMSPLNVIGRGYSLTHTESGKILKEVDQVDIGDTIDVRLSDGSLLCEVLQKKEREKR